MAQIFFKWVAGNPKKIFINFIYIASFIQEVWLSIPGSWAQKWEWIKKQRVCRNKKTCADTVQWKKFFFSEPWKAIGVTMKTRL